jgi:DNA primase
MNYLKKRGLNDSKILEWKIGYCPTGDYKERVIIPSFDDDGDVNYFISRTFSNDWKKYKNPEASKDIVFNELLIDWEEPVVLVEGVFDAVQEPNMIPILGSTLQEKTILFQKLVEKQAKVYIALDSDAKHKEAKIIANLVKYGLDVWKISTTDNKDVGEMSKWEYQRAKQNAQKVDFEYELFNINI